MNIYIHIPFCTKKCYYCHFFTFAGIEKKIPLYFKALFKEIEAESKNLKDNLPRPMGTRYYKDSARKLFTRLPKPFGVGQVGNESMRASRYLPSDNKNIDTIYIGGGTPSVVDPSLIEELILKIRNNYKIKQDAEITIEVNPESVNLEKLKYYKKIGINRISIGLQAWQNHHLLKLGRTYTNNVFAKSIELIKVAGFTNFNIDVMFGLPDQTLEEFQETISKVIEFQPKHISSYSLELDNNSYWGILHEKGKFETIDEKLDREMYKFLIKTLEENGYQRYEISNFSKQGFESQHNSNFWKYQDYIGFGAAAHSKIGNTRYNNFYSIEKYISAQMKGLESKDEIITMSEQEMSDEFALLRLRLSEGLDIQELEKFSAGNEFYDATVNKLQELIMRQLVEIKSKRYYLTNKGYDLYNEVFRELM